MDVSMQSVTEYDIRHVGSVDGEQRDEDITEKCVQLIHVVVGEQALVAQYMTKRVQFIYVAKVQSDADKQLVTEACKQYVHGNSRENTGRVFRLDRAPGLTSEITVYRGRTSDNPVDPDGLTSEDTVDPYDLTSEDTEGPCGLTSVVSIEPDGLTSDSRSSCSVTIIAGMAHPTVGVLCALSRAV